MKVTPQLEKELAQLRDCIGNPPSDYKGLLEILPESLRPFLSFDSKLGWAMLRHPLLYCVPFLGHKFQLDQITHRIPMREAKIKECAEKGDLESIIYLHERPYRVNALFSYRHVTAKLSDPLAAFYTEVGSVWIDSENIWQDKSGWSSVWEEVAKSGKAHLTMEESDREFLTVVQNSAVEGRIRVFRGAVRGRNHRGLSWTVDRKMAAWFSKRLQDGRVFELSVPPDNIIAGFNGRKESEVVIDPNFIRRAKLT